MVRLGGFGEREALLFTGRARSTVSYPECPVTRAEELLSLYLYALRTQSFSLGTQ